MVFSSFHVLIGMPSFVQSQVFCQFFIGLLNFFNWSVMMRCSEYNSFVRRTASLHLLSVSSPPIHFLQNVFQQIRHNLLKRYPFMVELPWNLWRKSTGRLCATIAGLSILHHWETYYLSATTHCLDYSSISLFSESRIRECQATNIIVFKIYPGYFLRT